MQLRTRPAFAIFLVAAYAAFAAGEALAADAPLEKFFGRYEGSGVTRSPHKYRMGYTDRDMDVEIGPEDNGFFVAWTTVFLQTFSDQDVRRKSARVVFVPSERPGIYLAKGAKERVADGFGWASIKEDVLSVRLLSIEDDGSYVIQNYHRSLTDAGLLLQFVSDEDGQAIRMVHARLKKVK